MVLTFVDSWGQPTSDCIDGTEAIISNNFGFCPVNLSLLNGFGVDPKDRLIFKAMLGKHFIYEVIKYA